MKAFTVLVASFLFAGVALASSAQAAIPGNESGTRSQILSPTMFLSPGSQTVNTGNAASWNLNWGDHDLFDESFAVYYDGGSVFDTYTCFSNCQNGNAPFAHVYSTSGTRFPIGADDHGAWSNSVVVNVN